MLEFDYGKELLQTERNFNNQNFNNQLKILNFFSDNTIDKDLSDLNKNYLAKLKEIKIQLIDLYIKTDIQNINEILEGNLNNSVFNNGFRFFIMQDIWMREYSNPFEKFSENEKEFLLDEIFEEIIIKKMHNSHLILLKRLEEKFDGKFNPRDIKQTIMLFKKLINTFLDEGITVSKMINYLNNNTLLSKSSIYIFVNKLLKFQSELERVYILNKVRKNI